MLTSRCLQHLSYSTDVDKSLCTLLCNSIAKVNFFIKRFATKFLANFKLYLTKMYTFNFHIAIHNDTTFILLYTMTQLWLLVLSASFGFENCQKFSTCHQCVTETVSSVTRRLLLQNFIFSLHPVSK